MRYSWWPSAPAGGEPELALKAFGMSAGRSLYHIHSVVLRQPSLHKAVRDLSRFIALKPLCFFDQITVNLDAVRVEVEPRGHGRDDPEAAAPLEQ